jgi:hypothetical protein
MCGDSMPTYQYAFHAGYCLAEARFALRTPVIEGRWHAAAASRNTSTGLSKLTRLERLAIGKVAHDKLVFHLNAGLPEDDARGRAYDTAYAWGHEKYGDRMPKRSNAYPKRYLDEYLRQSGLPEPTCKTQGKQS